MAAQDTTVEALGVAVAAKVPVLLWGAPGTGKTSAIRAMAEAANLPCETVIAAIREPSDFSGLPVIVDGVVHFAPPRWAERLAQTKEGEGILFLDEISTAPPAVQAALLRVVLERVVGDLALPEGIVVVAAANPPELAADGWDLSAPLANRFCHLDWTVEAMGFAQGIAGGWKAPKVPALPATWQEHLPLARGMVSAFIAVRPALALDVPTDAARAGRGWPSPRTWEMAARLWTAADVAGASQEAKAQLVAGAVGDAAAIQLLTWQAEMDLPDPEDLLANPDTIDLPTRGDRAYAVLSAVAAAVAANPTLERWNAGWKVLARAGERAPDVAAVAARVLAQCRPPGAQAPPEVKLFLPLLKDAGLLPPT
jgi:hypothetical protein